MRIGFTIALSLLAGCRFSVRGLDLADAAVPDLSSNASDDLTPRSDAVTASDAMTPDAALDLATPADLLPPGPDLAHSCGDGVKNGDESAIDCGGSCPKCSDGRTCGGNNDCLSTHCLKGVCVQCITGTQCGVPLEFCVQNLCDALTTGLVAYWKMDEAAWINDCSTATVEDSSGNNHAGLDCPASGGMAGGPTAGSRGKFGTAGAFGGTEQHIDVPASAAFNTGTGDFTISLWVQLGSLASDAPVFESLSSPTSHQMLVHHATTGWAFEQRAGVTSSNAAIVAQAAASTTLNVWHHLALARSGNSWTIYLDGASVATATNAAAIVDTTGLVLGWSRDTSIQLNGFLDDYRFYNRALTANEIKAFSL